MASIECTSNSQCTVAGQCCTAGTLNGAILVASCGPNSPAAFKQA